MILFYLRDLQQQKFNEDIKIKRTIFRTHNLQQQKFNEDIKFFAQKQVFCIYNSRNLMKILNDDRVIVYLNIYNSRNLMKILNNRTVIHCRYIYNSRNLMKILNPKSFFFSRKNNFLSKNKQGKLHIFILYHIKTILCNYFIIGYIITYQNHSLS